MGLLDLFKPKQTTPHINSILPDIAQREILNDRLPILNTNKIFLKSGEQCHYIDKAIYEKKTMQRRYVRRNAGYSTKGLFKGSRIYTGGGHTDVVEQPNYETIRGILYITNRRLIFVGENGGFDKKISDLVAITPYANCVELQFAKETYKIFVPDGNVTHKALQLIR